MEKIKKVEKLIMCRYNPLRYKQAIADISWTYHYFTTDALWYCSSATENDGARMSLPKGNTMTSQLSAKLPYKNCSTTAIHETLFPTIK